MPLEGHVGIVTGAGSGIGRASAGALAAANCRVIVSDIDDEAGNETAAQIIEDGGEVRFVHADVSVASECEALVAAAVDHFGSLSVLHANAGISRLHVDGPTASLDPELWDRMIAINLSGVFYCAHYALPAMAAAGGGSIINTASSMATVPLGVVDAYAASKGGVALLTRSMCVSAGEVGVRVNAIGPGYVDTPMNAAIWSSDMARSAFERGHATGLQDPEEIADLVVFLASDASRSLTGAVLTCDRGWTAFKAPDFLRGG